MPLRPLPRPWLAQSLLAAAATAAAFDLPFGVPDHVSRTGLHIFQPDNLLLKSITLSNPAFTHHEEADEPGEPISDEEFALSATSAAALQEPPLDDGSPDPILAAGLFEGDIAGVSPEDVLEDPDAAYHDGSTRRWEGGVVPYVISAAFTGDERLQVAAAFREFHELTCVRFVPRTGHTSYVHLRKGVWCSSLIGRVGGEQTVSLGPGCVYKGVVQHELMHALGFWHEHSRSDRDAYVTVLLHNVRRGYESQFQKHGWHIAQSLGLPYDTGSLLHYGRLAFSRDGRSPTIVPRDPRAAIGQRLGFSEVDVAKINLLYGCRNTLVRRPTPPTQPPPRPVCAGSDRFCNHWARFEQCLRLPFWMKLRLVRDTVESCRVAGVAADRACADEIEECERWAQQGECATSADYMAAFCPAACGTCWLPPACTTNMTLYA
ncbi:low choriolytic enzyme-like [Schistocerca piceifrons]|uniref:low choriolytic enzyme-like n=1 Tax=Schistocerca piceifrons TaxID=274613 RepID=UPI001F5F2190|nr:low choriolytic enzyme-like [Schistocerca piceifrons]